MVRQGRGTAVNWAAGVQCPACKRWVNLERVNVVQRGTGAVGPIVVEYRPTNADHVVRNEHTLGMVEPAYVFVTLCLFE